MSRACIAATLAAGSLMSAALADTARISVTHDSEQARQGEVIVVPFAELAKVLPDARMFHVQVRDAAGAVVPSQITNYEHDHRGLQYDDLVFQYDLPRAGEPMVFTLETTQQATPPIEPRVFARKIPERFDDFAWENDRIAHRMYGPALNSPAAGGERLRGSGIDIWGKRVPYLIVDRWYLKGHDQFHKDGEGEGLDLYSIGGSRGAGGTGIWLDGKLHTSDNFESARVLANGPLRAVFELSYAPWDIGNGRKVSETKRFTVEAGRNFHAVESVFTFDGPDELTVGLGISRHRDVPAAITQDDAQRWLNVWESSSEGGLGVAVILEPQAKPAGFAEQAVGTVGNHGNQLILTRVKSGQPLHYWIGAGWERSGQFASRDAWDAYVKAFVERTRASMRVKVGRVTP
jgi:pectinesterase